MIINVGQKPRCRRFFEFPVTDHLNRIVNGRHIAWSLSSFFWSTMRWNCGQHSAKGSRKLFQIPTQRMCQKGLKREEAFAIPFQAPIHIEQGYSITLPLLARSLGELCCRVYSGCWIVSESNNEINSVIIIVALVMSPMINYVAHAPFCTLTLWILLPLTHIRTNTL